MFPNNYVERQRQKRMEKLQALYPENSRPIPLEYFDGSYENFLLTKDTFPASTNQLLGIGIKHLNPPQEEVENFVKTLEKNGIKWKDNDFLTKEDFINKEYVHDLCSIDIPMIIDKIFVYKNDGSAEKYKYLSGEFMFNQIKKYLSED